MANSIQMVDMAMHSGTRSTASEVTSGRRSLKPNPFTTYRDPATGRWIVVKPSPDPTQHNLQF